MAANLYDMDIERRSIMVGSTCVAIRFGWGGLGQRLNAHVVRSSQLPQCRYMAPSDSRCTATLRETAGVGTGRSLEA